MSNKLPAVVSPRGAARWASGPPWISRSDVLDAPRGEAGVVAVADRRGRVIGQALYSPKSEIRLRLLATGAATIDAQWWRFRIAAAAARRESVAASAYRGGHGEGDGLPSLIVDGYGPSLVGPLL